MSDELPSPNSTRRASVGPVKHIVTSTETAVDLIHAAVPIIDTPGAEIDIIVVAATEDVHVEETVAASVAVPITDEVQELEVEIRSLDESVLPQRDLLADALRLIRENLVRLQPPQLERVTKLLREQVLNSDYLDPDFWKGIGMVVQYQVDDVRGFLQRRVRGQYTVDDYGMDAEVVELLRPFAGFLYRSWWRVSATGIEQLPATGPLLLVANHGGAIPWDGAMVATALLDEHAAGRLTRVLHDRWMAAVPGLAPALAAVGQVPASPEHAARLLAAGHPVCVFPEGAAAAGRPFAQRYRLDVFDATGYVRAAAQSGAVIVPVAIIGSEETYPVLANLMPLAKLFNLPYFPITPLFPWLGPLGLLPLPSKWTIVFGTPIAAPAAEDVAAITTVAAELKTQVQALLDARGAAIGVAL